MSAEPVSATVSAVIVEPLQIALAKLRTPIGVIAIAATADRVVGVDLPRARRRKAPASWGRFVTHQPTPASKQASAELRDYFQGRRTRFTIPVAPAGTVFQRRVWQAIAAIPFGETSTYGAIAEALGGVHLARAVGSAVAANPIPIIIPCHRVIGSDGSLTGYAGGLSTKVWLLRHEHALLA